jgi:hypothetical protein
MDDRAFYDRSPPVEGNSVTKRREVIGFDSQGFA